ncbi:hypothetical protein V8G54_035138 [Vigna mungo]|uniref:Uncharacterized protein n=1 Tax=Vigna mungo TaxID=3915 RepID=A0AAQ3MG03_VIGMU
MARQLQHELNKPTPEEAKDLRIKLFGKTIALSEIPIGSAGGPASSFGDLVDDSVENTHASSSNSSMESHTRDEGVLDEGWEGGEDVIEVAEVRVGGEDDVRLGFEVEERVNGNAGI